MPRKKPTPASTWKHEYQMQKKRGETKDQLERQRARRAYDKRGIDRAGKDIDHIKPLREGGRSSTGNLRLRSPSANQADNKHGNSRKSRS